MDAPEPRHPGQTIIFPAIVDTTFATPESPMSIQFTVTLHRTPRQKCSACKKRRITFFVGLGSVIRCPALCAKCSGIR